MSPDSVDNKYLEPEISINSKLSSKNKILFELEDESFG